MAMKWLIKDKFTLMSAVNVLKDLEIFKTHILELKEVKGKRSISQNNLMWLWCTFVSRETGQSNSDIYYEMKEKYSPYKEYKGLNGELCFRQYALSELDKKQYHKVLEQTKDFWYRFAQIDLVWPDDYRFNLFYEEAKDG